MEAGPKKKWLLLAHAFNMDGIASSQTVTDKIPHLLAAGIAPIVVSAPTGRRDAQLEHHQVFSPFPSGLRYELRHYFKQRGGRGWLKNLVMILILPFYALEKILVPLGSHWSWFMSAIRTGRKVIGRERIELIYSSGGANSAHLAGFWLARRSSLPWLAEVHDPMIHADWKKGPFQYRWSAWIEGLICKHADAAIWFTPTALARARARHPALGERGHVMYPGANPPARVTPYRRGPHFVLAHFGSLAENRNLEQTFAALDVLFTQQPAFAQTFRLRTYGGGWDSHSEAALAKFRWPQVVEPMGRLEFDPATGLSGRERVLDAMQTVDCLLLLHGEDAFCEEYFPSKLYEYLWARRPILALVLRNADLDAFLKREGHASVAASDAPAAAGALSDLIARWQRDALGPSGRPSQYSTARAVAQLVAIADAAVRAKAAAR